MANHPQGVLEDLGWTGPTVGHLRHDLCITSHTLAAAPPQTLRNHSRNTSQADGEHWSNLMTRMRFLTSCSSGPSEALGQSWRRPGLQPGLSLLLTHLLQCLSVKWGKQYTISFYKTSITHVHLKSSEQRLTPANVSYGYYEIRIYFSVYSIYRLHF